ncbi:M23 family metallopeptidase [Alkalicoccus chagannorensis]|uniref:M23 family metallopeptidase n=1 Tax=Alkalicoccus chagannorensis TaxID=427072 RepID=UPI00040080A0|nr:M23 family metallopeptidase [Alkalicoccus chagannorensis]
MKKTYTLTGLLLLLTACADNNDDSDAEESQSAGNGAAEGTEENETADEQNEEEEAETVELHQLEEHEGDYVLASDIVELTGGEMEEDAIHRSMRMDIDDRHFYFVEEVPVMEINGIYQPYDDVLVAFHEEEPYLTDTFVERGLDTETEAEDGELHMYWDEEPEWEEIGSDVDIHDKTPVDMVEFLSFMERPIEGASVSTVESHLPGAPRDYRNGVHEGIDYYDYASGVEITTDTEIYGMAEGTVVRVDHDFEEYPSHEVRDADLEKSAEVGFTPEYIFDRLRGQQVWVQYEDGIMIRFAHLDDIPEELELGQQVDADTAIGYVGNTGTSDSLNDGDGGLHLHKDILVSGELFWEPYTLEETAAILYDLWP